MERIPRKVLDALEDLYKRHSISPRDYPGVHIHWQGCGDDGGIDEITFLSPIGIQYAKTYSTAPPAYSFKRNGSSVSPSEYYYTKERAGHDNIMRDTVFSVDEENDYTIGKFIYERFGVCEINDGGYAHVFIEMPHGNIWGESWDWVTEERSNTCVSYED